MAPKVNEGVDMGLLRWLRSICGDSPRNIEVDSLADYLAMGLMNRILLRFDNLNAKREAVYFLNSTVFLCLVAHPIFDEESGESFYNEFLRRVASYGVDAELWSGASPLQSIFPDGLELYMATLEHSDLGKGMSKENLQQALHETAAVAVEHFGEAPSEKLVADLRSMGWKQMLSTWEAFEGVGA